MKRSPLLPIFLIVLVDILGLTIILPLLPFYAESFGASATVVGLLISSYAACQLVAGPVLGSLSDTMGRKPLLIVSQIGTLIGFLILARATALWVVFLSRIIDGATAGNLSLAQAYISDVTEPQNRSKAFGVIGISFGIGFLIGPWISGYLSQFGLARPIYAAAGLSALSILCTSLLLPKSDPGKQGGEGPGGRRLGVFDWKAYGAFFTRPGLGPLLWQFLCFAFAFSLSISGFALFAERRYTWNGHPMGAKEVGYVFAYIGFLGIILQGALIGRLVKTIGERAMVWSGFGVGATSAVWFSLTRTVPQLLANATYGSYGSGVLRPALTSLITQKADRREQGVVLGLTQSLTSISQIIAPLITGVLIDAGHLSLWALSSGVVMLVGLIASLRTRHEVTVPAV